MSQNNDTMSARATGVRKNESAVLSSDFESDTDAIEITTGQPLLRRSSSLFSLSDKENIPKPDDTEYQQFIADNRHFSMIRNLHMADFITLLNGFSGFYAILSCCRYCLSGDLGYIMRAEFFILLGVFADFFDGRVARLRNKSSLMGQELDSLADLVSFGVAPATIAFCIGFRTTVDTLLLTYWVLCGLTRLARFNISTDKIPKDQRGKSQYFEGMPIPSNLIWVAVFAFLVSKSWVGVALPFGTAFTGTPFEFHLFSLIFFLQGSAQISKSLHVPKP
ncbi:hypothetical protein DIURU_000678 [Diutina rugosa]|uniref:CDP-diacylglycerol--serine O-phosphatidyltransferase n=1 Tax=Diutina rugosa TaxID=5481 RepID=A0A642UYE8_DIURU|nr:uncharacterized protein DIURU_000678 [Diutina rugosa]KAA8906994.1 hypothetical protein DIURU_000678 [Diutina rugosa]